MGNTSSQTLLDQIEVQRRQINILIEKEKKRKRRNKKRKLKKEKIRKTEKGEGMRRWRSSTHRVVEEGKEGGG